MVVAEPEALTELLEHRAFVRVDPAIRARHQRRERDEEILLFIVRETSGELRDARVGTLLVEVDLRLDRLVVERTADERGVHRDELRALGVVDRAVRRRDEERAGEEIERVAPLLGSRRLGSPRGDGLACIGDRHRERVATRAPFVNVRDHGCCSWTRLDWLRAQLLARAPIHVMDFGIDRLHAVPDLVARLRGARVGLLAHAASVDRSLRHVEDVLAALHVAPRVIFGPEHGYGGEAQDMIGVASARHATTGAPIVSLYGDDFASLSPGAAELALADVLVVDLADVGSRYYTFVWTALLALRAAAKAGVHFVVLDRPNPLGARADDVEGNLPAERFLSFVGLEPVPVRHGLTVGEIVALFAARDGLPLGPDGALSIVPVAGHDGGDARSWDRPFVLPSPNMPTFDTALVYPGGCLLEGTNLSEGRGVTRPFEIFGAPFVDGRALAAALARSGLPGFVARALTFRPTFHKHAGAVCGGVQIHVTDARAFRPYATYLAAIGHARRLAPEAFRFRTEKYEFRDDVPAIDLLTGGADFRSALESGGDPDAIARAVGETPAAWAGARAAARAAHRSAAWASASR